MRTDDSGRAVVVRIGVAIIKIRRIRIKTAKLFVLQIQYFAPGLVASQLSFSGRKLGVQPAAGGLLPQ